MLNKLGLCLINGISCGINSIDILRFIALSALQVLCLLQIESKTFCTGIELTLGRWQNVKAFTRLRKVGKQRKFYRRLGRERECPQLLF